jgi:hypothetical protein
VFEEEGVGVIGYTSYCFLPFINHVASGFDIGKSADGRETSLAEASVGDTSFTRALPVARV